MIGCSRLITNVRYIVVNVGKQSDRVKLKNIIVRGDKLATEKVSVTLDKKLLERIDEARKHEKRSTWINRHLHDILPEVKV